VGVKCDISLDEVIEAYFSCRENKRGKESALHFELNLEENLVDLYRELIDGTYEIGASLCFVVKKPRTREIWAASFRDRVVHHIIYNRLHEEFNRSFVDDSCACIPNRGTAYGIKRLEKHIRSFTNNWNEDYYYLKCDLSNFFVSIDKSILWSLLEKKLTKGSWVTEMTKMVLFHDPRDDVVFNSSVWEMEEVPERKRLLLAPPNKGLPIGNLTSQFFANVLLDYLDKHIKHKLKVSKYIRYVDDFIILGKDVEYLKNIHKEIQPVLKVLGVSLNDSKTVLQPIKRGVSFVGQTVYPFRRVPLRRTYLKCVYNIENDLVSDVNCTVAYFKQSGNHYNLLMKLFKRLESSYNYSIDYERMIIKSNVTARRNK
jgi:hypothetical protein